MTLDKLVIKCGNFAVLVDFHIASQDHMWFSDHQREEVCLLLKDAVESRVKQYLKARKLHGRCKQTEHGEANSLSLRADEFQISAYFVKRWANLRCIGQQHSELRVFPDRFVIYVSRFEPNPSSWVRESVALEENLFTKVSEYFQGSAEDRKCQISLTQQEKQDTLKKLMKRATHANKKKPQPRMATTKVYLGSPDSDTE
ncbi:protein SLX4IP [Notechis scutatus]|uniref:Protein SLX4IP n=1 Tax=Notechis scutatus TaxID=8663 RepID=A0A6J1U0M5_9SAUR|nr:protein SLX4IP [Notechis scutatus]